MPREKGLMSNRAHWSVAASLALLCVAASADDFLPAPESDAFCGAVQKILASTDRQGSVTLFTDMPAYRASKPMVDPLTNYQVVTYRGQMPIVVSCKVKTAAHLRAAYGEAAAGEQFFCPEITRRVQAQAVAELRATDPAAAERAASFVIEETEPSITGQSYLQDFQPGFLGEDGRIHFQSPGLFQNYDHWITWFLPERVQGQSYCHIPTVAYMKALATGAMEPGTTVTTTDDAPVTPQRAAAGRSDGGDAS
jgi:hypothetical protein